MLTISHGKKETDIASVKSEFWKNKQGECMKRMHRVLSSFSRGSKNARLNQLMFRNLKTVETNANGTSGYVIKSGKNSGEILGHLKKEAKKFQLKKMRYGKDNLSFQKIDFKLLKKIKDQNGFY